ncbi:TIGR03759 family integrating conjugative element protein [uncultured Pseudoteredinibacter sp.]|uniref:TIGR03759 family integrating conjugative element protein n=1 Tax=uncultured Pseudoteredinibacter sp. TaxID=1641701 RepID=UPI00261A1F2C|nr:TIGR03759 family integrating conjugative element protein [uncultured Pseudoteredinibacter sp.]
MRLLIILICSCCSIVSFKASASGQEQALSEAITSEVEVSKAISLNAKRWNIEPSEYQRYTELLKGPLGKWNLNIDPILALGMFADSPAERQRFAELYAQQEFKLTQRTLQFQSAYRQAFNRLYPNQPVIDSEGLVPFRENRALRKQSYKSIQNLSSKLITGDQVFVFFSKQCTSCHSNLSRLIQIAQNIKGVTVRAFILEASSDSDVVTWSKNNSLPGAWLESGLLSLNRDEGLLTRLRRQSGNRFRLAHPMYLLREGRYYDVNMEMKL